MPELLVKLFESGWGVGTMTHKCVLGGEVAHGGGMAAERVLLSGATVERG